MWVGSFKSWVSPYWDVKLWTLAPSGVVLCFIGRTPFIKLALKSPMMTVIKGLYCIGASSVKSKL